MVFSGAPPVQEQALKAWSLALPHQLVVVFFVG